MAVLIDRFGERRGAGLLPRWLVPWARARVWITYSWQQRRALRLGRPRLFTELIQARKLFERDPRYVPLIDKLRVKADVARILGEEWVTPTLWSGTDLPATPPWPTPFVVKARHGCRQTAFVFSSDRGEWASVRRRASRWQRRPYARWLDEWAYSEVPRGLIVEPFVGDSGRLPRDYKVFVFGGVATHVQVHVDRDGDHRWRVFDRDWRSVGHDDEMPPPRKLAEMLDAAERLAEGFAFVRVDLYEVAGEPRFGELTFYPGSGLLRIEPRALDAEWGRLWLSATGQQQ